MADDWWKQLAALPKGGYTQLNEQWILHTIFERIGTQSRYVVDLGAHDGFWYSNSRHFLDQGWRGCLIDGAHETKDVHKAWITEQNVVELLLGLGVPRDFDLLSIDIDGQDYWVLRALLRGYSTLVSCDQVQSWANGKAEPRMDGGFRPRVIVAEYNGAFAEHECKTVPLDPHFTFKENDHYGASYGALCKLAEAHGYKTLCNNGLNVFFIEEQSAPEGLTPPPYKPVYGWPKAPPGALWVEV